MLSRDIRFAFRSLLKAPGFTAVAILVLGLGIGANTAVFTIINAALLKSPAGDKATGQVVGVYSLDRTKPDNYRGFSYPNFVDVKAGARQVFTDVTAAGGTMVGLKEGDQTRRVLASVIPSNYFSTFGTKMAKGRTFSAEEEKPGSALPVVIVSYEFWRKHGASDSLLGSTIQLNSRPFTVVGVASRNCSLGGSIITSELWLPLGVSDMLSSPFRESAKSISDRASTDLIVYGRLKPGLDVSDTNAALKALSAEMERAYPAENKNQVLLAHELSRFSVSTSPEEHQDATNFSMLLSAMTAIVLAIACLNLANMLLARGSSRRKEIAIRLALGSGRLPVIRQLMTEGLLLSLCGGALGLLIAYWSSQLLLSSMTPALPFISFSLDTSPDIRVLLVTLAFCVFSTLIFGLGPAWKLSRTNVVPELKEQGGESISGSGRRINMRNALVVGQVALSLALLTAAGLFVRAAGKASSADPGFGLGQSVLLNVDAEMAGYKETKGRETYRVLMERVRSLPGVQSASLASIVPFGDTTVGRRVEKVASADDRATGTDDRPSMSVGSGSATPKDRGNAIGVNYYVVGAAYLKTLGIRVVRGREFNDQEEQSPNGSPRAIINETLAKKLFPKDDAVGQYIRFADVAENEQPSARRVPVEIIGVAAPVLHNMFDENPPPQVYVPFGQHYLGNMFVHVKVARAGSEPAIMQAIRQELRTMDDRLPVLSLRTLSDFRDKSVSVWIVKTGAQMFSAIGLAAVFMALVGLYGVKSYLVARRTREIGIRMSLGATPRNVLWLIVRDGLSLVAVGLTIGLGMSVLVSSGVRSMLYQVSALDPVTFVAAPLLLAAAALLACYFPARRAMKIMPLKALRFE